MRLAFRAPAAVATTALVALHAVSAQARPARPAVRTTPATCLDAARRYVDAHYRAAKAANPKAQVDLAAIERGARTQLRACAAQFTVASIAVPELNDLGRLYLRIQEREQAARAFTREISSAGPSDVIRAYLFAGGDSADRARNRSIVERYLSRIDSIPHAVAQRLQVRYSLMGYYDGANLDDGADRTARELLSLARELPPAEQQQTLNAAGIFAAYNYLAELYANRLQVDSAIAMLRRPDTDFPALAAVRGDVREVVTTALARYEMIGKPAPAFRADAWINGRSGDLRHAVTLIMFTAKWCDGCRESYPAVRQLVRDFGPKGFRLVLAVNFDGVVDGVPMTHAQEVHADRRYYADHGFTGPIAMQQRGTTDSLGIEVPSDSSNWRRYHLEGIPQYDIVDQHGIVRAILTGWDGRHAREHLLRGTIARLIASDGTT